MASLEPLCCHSVEAGREPWRWFEVADELNPVCLLAPGVRLRPMSLADTDAMYRIHSDPSVSRFTSTQPPHRTPDVTERMIRNMLQRPGAQLWMIDSRTADASAMHGCGWVGWFSDRSGVANVAINLRPDARGRRRAREAMVSVMLHAFQHHGFNRLGADIDAENLASLRMFESLGFSFEGRLRHYWKTQLGWRDSLIYSMLASDIEQIMPRWASLSDLQAVSGA